MYTSMAAAVRDMECQNNLDTYLNDLYEKEVKFSVSNDETEQIRNAVESIVYKIIDKIAESEPKLCVNTKDVLKVGSFYEGTKICYPDEFDYIAAFESIYSNPRRSRYEKDRDEKRVKERLKLYSWHLTRAVGELESHNDTSVEMELGKLMLDTTPESHGPATKLCLYYVKDGGRNVKGIHVDITAAVKVKGAPYDGMFAEGTPCGQLREMAQNYGSHLLIFNYDQDLPYIETFTETEMQYINSVMSVHHKKVFKILKYLVNGDNTTEQNKGHVFSSYALKTMMFHHCFECTGANTTSTCVLKVLQSIRHTLREAINMVSNRALKGTIKVWHNILTGHAFSKKLGTEVKKCIWFLGQLINSLEKIKREQMSDYCYEKYRVQAKCLIDCF